MKKRVNRGGAWLAAMLMSAAIACQALAQAPAMPKLPILEGTTYAVLKLDLNQIDGEGMTKWLVDSTDKLITDPAEKQQMISVVQNQFGTLVQAQQIMI